MTQIHQNNTVGASALAALGQNTAATKSGSSGTAGAPAFAQWLNQSHQQLQTQTQPQTVAPQQPARPQTPAAQARSQAQAQRQPASTTQQDENKLNARNAANRASANKASEGHAQPTRATGKANTDASEHAAAADAAKAHAKAGAKDSSEVRTEDGKTAQATDEKDTATTDGSDATGDPAAQILAMLRGDAPVEAKTGRHADGTDDAAQDGDAVTGGGAHTRGHHAGGAQDRQQLLQDLKDAAKVAQGATEGQEAADGKEALQAVSSGAHEIPGGETKPHAPQQSFEALLAAAQNAPAGSTAAEAKGRAEAPSVPLSQHLHSPEFAPELSASVSLLIQDGVHEAQLQLNPTEMGPVSINIQLDGQQAQVNFHAQHAATREVLERSLPDLAAALQAQGVTLSGGGVFAQQQSSGGQNDRDAQAGGTRGGRGGRGGDDEGDLGAVTRAERRPQARGLVDLYA